MSRLAIVGHGDDGRSRVVDIRDVSGGISSYLYDARVRDLLHMSREPRPAPGRRHDATVPDIEIAPGPTRWTMLSFEPGHATPLRGASTCDLVVVLQGEVALGLEDGELTLRVGDHAFIPAAIHSWRTGSLACTISVVHCGVMRPSHGTDDLEVKRRDMKREMWEVICRGLLWLA